MVKQAMHHNIHNVLEHLSGLTAQKDFELLTFSLLKSLSSLMSRARVQTIALSRKNQPVRQFNYSNGELDINVDQITLDPRLKSALLKAHSSGLDAYEEQIGSQSLAIYLLVSEQQVTHYLLVAMPGTLGKADAYLIAGVREIYRNFSALLMSAQTDELTGLANRKTFETAILRVSELQRVAHADFDNEKRKKANKQADNYWLCAIDIDHFKKVNDTYGHLYGDEVLISLAQIMRTEFRQEDLLFRFGGEEFLALIKSPDKDSTRVGLERFRKAVEAAQFSKVDAVTVSIGVVEIDPTLFHMTLMDYADQALYFSKRQGRNQTTFFSDLVAKGLARVETFEEGSVDLF